MRQDPDIVRNTSQTVSYLFTNHWHSLCGCIQSRYGSEQFDPEDVVQEAFVRYVQCVSSAEIKDAKAFVFAIAKNAAIDILRSHSKRTSTTQYHDSETDQSYTGDFSPEVLASDWQSLEIIQSVLDNLPTKQKELFHAHRIEGETYLSIAKRTGYSLGDISRNLNHVNRKMKSAADLA